jgi:2-succinyl-6-hydroxy-2,4-cyclohexadiene-1-carboxylate synthase
MPSVNILGVQHSYELTDAANAEPVLVFVHGWLLSRRYWDPLIEHLSPSHQCLAYDLRGFGESRLEEPRAFSSPVDPKSLDLNPAIASSPLLDENQSRYAPAAYAHDLVLLLKELNISKAWLIGHSLGGSISLWAAALAPQVIEGVICLNSGGGIYVQEAFDRFRAAGEAMLRFRPSWLPHVPLLDLAFSHIMVNQALTRNWGKQRLIDFVAAHPEAALRSLLDSTVPDQVHLLPQVVSLLQQPVTFIAGQQDPVMELKYVYHLASFHKAFQNGQPNVIEIPNCGHMGMLEQTDAIAQEIQQILDDSSTKNQSLLSLNEVVLSSESEPKYK